MKHIHTEQYFSNPTQQEQFLRLSGVIPLVALSKATVLRLERAGKFPKSIRITTRCVAYRSSQIREWMTDPLNYKAPC